MRTLSGPATDTRRQCRQRRTMPNLPHGTLKIPMVQPAEGTITTPAVSSTPGLNKDGIAAFVSELSTYYMDFLKTDFHKRRTPKRSVKFRNSKNLRVGLDLAKYNAFQSSVLNVLENGMTRPLNIPRGKYRAVVSQKVKDFITAHTKSISDEVLAEVSSKHYNKNHRSRQSKDDRYR